MEDITLSLRTILQEGGASLVGFADLSVIEAAELSRGVSVAVAIPPEVVHSIGDGPNRAYFNAYHEINRLLDRLVTAGERFLRARNYSARAQTVSSVSETDDYRTRMPHKTVATRAGLGWIGKSALLVTEQYGPAVRISSLLTDAPLRCGTPVEVSRCGGCMACRNACPGGAVSGRLWRAGVDRDEFFNPIECRRKARELAAARIGEQITLCGKCIEICPFARRYLARTDALLETSP